MLALLLLSFVAAPPSAEQDSQAIKALVSSFREGMQKGDGAALVAVFWPDAAVFRQGSVDRSAKAFVNERLATELKTAKFKWLEEENLGRSDGPMAFVAQRAVLESGGKAAPHTFTFVFRKRDGAWKVAHLHWSSGKAVAASNKDGGS